MRNSLIMVLVTLLAGLPLTGTWPGKVQAADCAFGGGEDGSPGNPYVIDSKEDLDCVRDNLTASYQMGADIDLSDYGNWVPIGTDAAPFTGTFDGAGYAISGMKINSSADYIGLFGFASGAATSIANVRLVDADITTTGPVNVGGLVGVILDGTIDNSSVSGIIEGVATFMGGIAGHLGSAAKLRRSSTSVNINMSAGTAAGGLVGSLNPGTIIEQSYATGDISYDGNGYAGGLVGQQMISTILDSYATGRVTSHNSSASSGGLSGFTISGTITNSYATGRISPGTRSGGLIGSILIPFPVVTGSYWNSEANPGLNTIGLQPGMDGAASESAMKQMATYAGWWDDPAIWGIQEGTSYPYLKAFSPAVKADPVAPAYSVQSGFNELTISGSIRDGSIGEPLEVGYVIQNAVDATVTSAVYATVATGEDQAFHFSTTLNEADYPDGTYTLTVTLKDTVAAHNRSPSFTFVVDATAPAITLTGSDLIELAIGDTFTDPGATAIDNLAGDVTAAIITSGTVDTAQAGTYTLTYRATDAVGNTATATRTVKVYNSLFPQLQLNGLYTMQAEVGGAFTDPGATASDERDGDITDEIEITGSADTGRVGTYSIGYSVTNSLGNQVSTTRTVEVVDTTPPVLTLRGANPMRIEVGRAFTDPGATALDAGDGDLTADITVSGAVYANRVGTYTLTYQVQDRAGNKAPDAVRTVNVVRTSSPSTGGPAGGTPPAEEQTEEENPESTTPPAPGCPFTDIEKHWAKSEICEAAKLGIVEGVNAYAFLPNGEVTRTEFAVMLLRALRIEIDDEAGAVSFSDRGSIPKWADQAIRTAVAKGILSGYPDGTLRPLQKVDRSEMAAMVSKATKWKAGGEGNARFSDEATIPGWAKGYVEAARERGVLTGRDGNRFAPAEVATRAEAAVVLLRLWKVLY